MKQQGKKKETKAGRRRWRPRLITLQTRLTAPYVLLTILLATFGTYIITRLVTSSVQERFDNQLYEASRVAADGIVQQEKVHLANLRLMAFTSDVPEAMLNRDAAVLQALLWPLVLNNKIEVVTAVDLSGQEILTIARDPQTGQYGAAHGADFSGNNLITNVLSNHPDDLGDKFTGLAPTAFGPYLFTSAPVRDSAGRLTGALMVGANLQTLAIDLKSQALADVVILNPTGTLLAASLVKPDEGYGAVELAADEAAGLAPSLLRDLRLYGRSYKAAYAPLVIRQQVVGVLGVLLPSDYIFATGATSRNSFILIFTLGTMAMIGVGYILARTISRPILRLRAVSQAVAAGKLRQKTGLKRADEIGELASAFDAMTLKLRERTAEASRLYAESLRRNQELAEANAKLQAAQQQLVQSEKLAAIGQLTAGIVHDVKNPLAVIVGMADELQSSPETDPELLQECLRTMRDSAWRASVIVGDLLKFARQSKPEMKEQDLGATVATAARLTEYLARKARVQMIKDIPDEPVMVTYDATQIEQMLINLIQNAIQAMPKGGELRLNLSRTLLAAPGATSGAVAIAVQDTGIGIPPKNLSRIFDPFFTTKPPGEGTGLGLSVSYGIVARHSGRIEVASEEGKGTTFTILLPVAPPGDGPHNGSNKERRR